MPMVSGFMSRRERIAEAMGVAEKERRPTGAMFRSLSASIR